MLVYIPHTMSRKRNSIPFATSDQHNAPAAKRSRKDAATAPAGHNKGISDEENESLDLVVFSKPLRSRRLASVKAQIANTSLLNAEHNRSRSSSPNECNIEGDDREEAFVAKNSWPESLATGGPVRPHRFNEKISQRRFRGEEAESCSSSVSPLSSLGSEWDEENKVMDVKLKGPPPTIRTPVLHLIPVIECREVPAKTQPKAKKVVKPPMKLNGYVRRMASLNARACVSAMMEPTRRPTKKKSLPPNVPEPSTTSAESPAQSPQECLSRVSPQGSPAPQPGITNHSRPNSAEKEIVGNVTSPSSSKGYVVVCGSPNTLTECGIIQGSGYSEASAFNAEGLLWNGDTLHPQTRVYLTPDGTMPHLIVPPVCPTRPSRVQETKAFARTQHPKMRKKPTAVKGDNGWTAVGNPLKEVLFPHEDGTKIPRKYYAGVRRKNEELWVRDCITVKSGKRKQDRPYIAKIGSIWKEDKGGVMMTLFWYYRPEEAVGIQSADFQKDELLASQHYDDNSVACIEDKCLVLGIRQYCRYQAQCKSMAEGVSTLDSFSIVRSNPNEFGPLGLDSGSTGRKPARGVAHHVYLCHRGYNHIAGKLLKSHK